MDKLIDAFVALPMAAQITISIFAVIGVTIIGVAIVIAFAKTLVVLFRAPKAVPIAGCLSTGLAVSIGIGVTGKGECLSGLVAIVACVLVYEIAYWSRYDSRNNGSVHDPT